MLRNAEFLTYAPIGSAAHVVRHGLMVCTSFSKHCQFTMMPAESHVPW
jgi:hypothetical protein